MQPIQMKLIVAAMSAVVALSCGAVQAAPSYTVTDLGTLGGVYGSEAYGINASGQVVGNSPTLRPGNAYRQHAFIYSGGVMSDLGVGDASVALAINDSGQVTGYNGATYIPQAFLSTNGSVTYLGTLPGSLPPSSRGSDVNASGQVAGFTDSRAFLYSGGSMTDLGSFGGYYTRATGINDSGQIVGSSDLTGNATTHAFLYSGGGLTDLGTLGGTRSSANDINNLGQIVGGSAIAVGGLSHAFLYGPGGMMDLGTLGGSNSSANAINKLGQIVGYSQIAGDAIGHAFLYSDGTMLDLNSLIDPLSGWIITQANDINDLGQIAANSCNNSTGQSICRALLLTPVPEPETYLMMLAGLGLVGAMARRRNYMRK